MENDENPELEPEQEIEEEVEPAPDEGAEPEEVTPEETPEPTLEEKLAKAEAEAAKYRRLFEKTKKPKVETPKAPQSNPSSQPSVEEAVLLANGMPEELLAQLKKVAQVQGLSLIKAQADPIFVAVKDKFEKDQKQKAANLPASRGSGQAKPKLTLTTPGLSRDQHRKLAMEKMGLE